MNIIYFEALPIIKQWEIQPKVTSTLKLSLQYSRGQDIHAIPQ